jgi:uncharacterized RDD family membrane protein YckC
VARRVLARLFDLALLGLLATIGGLVWTNGLAPLQAPGALAGFSVGIAVELWLTATRGLSPGKALFAVRVRRRFAERPGWVTAVLRSLPLLCLPLPVLWALAPISWAWGLANPKRRGLHDLAAGTEVVLAGIAPHTNASCIT